MSDPEALATQAALDWGFPAPELVRAGMNTLFTAGDDVMIRVGHPTFDRAAEHRFLALLSRQNVRAPRTLHDRDGGNGVVVTAIERVHPDGDIDWREVGAMIRRVHSIDPLDAVGLPWCGDFHHWRIRARLDELGPTIDGGARAGMEACLTRWPGWQTTMRGEPRVVCHGDVHPGNVIPTDDGPVIIDWDLRCMGPLEWDHAPLMRWTERWGGEPGIYEQFADGYGRSLRTDPLAIALSEMRLLAATLMRLRAAQTDAAAAVEAEVRLRWWRGDPATPPWTAM